MSKIIERITELVRVIFVKVSLACRCKSNCQIGSENNNNPAENTEESTTSTAENTEESTPSNTTVL